MRTSLLADKLVTVKIKSILTFMNEIINPPYNSLLAMFFELSFEACRKRVPLCLKTLVRPKRTISQLFELLFQLPFLMSPKKKLPEREARRVLWEVQRDQLKMAEWARRGWYGSRRGGGGWGWWCCWWRWRGWGLWVRVWGFHALTNPSSKETCQEECVRGCRWRLSPSTMWVFKSSTFTINLSIRISLPASH